MKNTMAIDATLAALADPSRRQAIELIKSRPRRPGELAAELKLSNSQTSKHMKVLREAGLVQLEFVEDDARGRVYAMCPEALNDLATWVDAIRTMWADQLESLKSLAEAKEHS